MFGRKKKHEKKQTFMVRIAHETGFLNLKPTTLEIAREQAEMFHQMWIMDWHKHGSGSRPVVEIWEMVETIQKKVVGVDSFESNT